MYFLLLYCYGLLVEAMYTVISPFVKWKSFSVKDEKK